MTIQYRYGTEELHRSQPKRTQEIRGFSQSRWGRAAPITGEEAQYLLDEIDRLTVIWYLANDLRYAQQQMDLALAPPDPEPDPEPEPEPTPPAAIQNPTH